MCVAVPIHLLCSKYVKISFTDSNYCYIVNKPNNFEQDLAQYILYLIKLNYLIIKLCGIVLPLIYMSWFSSLKSLKIIGELA